MKLQLIILSLLVVATLAHRHGDQEGESQNGRRRHYRGRRRNDNQIAANAEEDADLEDSISSDDEHVNTERSHRRGCGGRRGERRGSHRHHFQHNPEYHQRHGVDGGEDEGFDHHSGHNAEWHEKHGVPMPNGESNQPWGRHHRKHGHHHRHHRTTTVAPTTTSTSSTVPPPPAEHFDTVTETDFNNKIESDSAETINFDP